MYYFIKEILPIAQLFYLIVMFGKPMINPTFNMH